MQKGRKVKISRESNTIFCVTKGERHSISVCKNCEFIQSIIPFEYVYCHRGDGTTFRGRKKNEDKNE